MVVYDEFFFAPEPVTFLQQPEAEVRFFARPEFCTHAVH
jgi:hypothetical protein